MIFAHFAWALIAKSTMARKRKNKANQYPTSNTKDHATSSASLPPPLPDVESAAFKLTAENEDEMSASLPPYRAPAEADEGEWEIPGRNKKPKKEKARKKRNYPEFVVSPQKLKRQIGLNDLQSLVLWLLADAPSPQWLSVKVWALPPCRGKY